MKSKQKLEQIDKLCTALLGQQKAPKHDV